MKIPIFGTHETFRTTTMEMILFWIAFMNSDYYSLYKKQYYYSFKEKNNRSKKELNWLNKSIRIIKTMKCEKIFWMQNSRSSSIIWTWHFTPRKCFDCKTLEIIFKMFLLVSWCLNCSPWIKMYASSIHHWI